MKKVYLAHPYGGKDYNVIWSRKLARRLSSEHSGCEILNAVGSLVRYKGVIPESQILQKGLDWLSECDELWVAPGWETSNGCKLEIAKAKELGMPITYVK